MKKLVSLALACLLAVALAACGSPAGNTPESAPGSTPASSTPLPESTPESTPDSSAATDLTTDRAGNPITPPAQVNGIVSMAASTTRTLYDLGLADKLGNTSYVAREVAKFERIVDYTQRENVAERLARRFGSAVGEGAVKALGNTASWR